MARWGADANGILPRSRPNNDGEPQFLELLLDRCLAATELALFERATIRKLIAVSYSYDRF